MRFFIIALALIIISDSNAQIGKSQKQVDLIEVGSVERLLGNYFTHYSLAFIEVEKGLKSYVLAFTDERTLYDKPISHPNEIISTESKMLLFKANESEFDYFYIFLKEAFKEDQIRTLEVGQDIVKTIPPRSGFIYIYVDFKDGTSASLKLKKRQLAKLFGKK